MGHSLIVTNSYLDTGYYISDYSKYIQDSWTKNHSKLDFFHDQFSQIIFH